MPGKRKTVPERAATPMSRTTVRVLNDLVGRRPRYLTALSVSGRLDLSVTTVRTALQELVRRRLVEFTEEPSRIDGQGPARTYRAAAHAVLVPESEIPRRGPAPASPQERAYEMLRELGRPVTLREFMEAAGLAETAAAKQLRALLAEGRVSRVQGPPPPVGSVRPWIWSVSAEPMQAAS